MALGLAAGLALALAPPAAVPAGAVAGSGAGEGSRAVASGPVITPTPWSVSRRSEEITVPSSAVLVIGSRTDASALEVVRQALRAAGVERLETRTVPGSATATTTVPPAHGRAATGARAAMAAIAQPAAVPPAARPPSASSVPAPVRASVPAADAGGLVVHVGGPAELAASAGALAGLGVSGPQGLPAGGYVLAAGRGADGTDRIVLSGADPAGTYYAAQSLRQVLPRADRPGARLPGVVVRDRPATAVRAVVEGFYDTPWSHDTRLHQLDYLGEHKMNGYLYSPKDDPYLRDRWREPYPPAELARLKELVDRARQRHVRFTFALSPGLSVCYSSPEEARALTDKLRSVRALGVRSFSVPLDDISYTRWNCAADEERFGTGGAAAGAAQALLLNRVREGLAQEDTDPLQTVPTEYYDVADTPYKKALREQLAPEVIVQWTGTSGIAPAITRADARAAREVFGHEVLVWDNFPVNDYVPGRLMLGPLEKRERGLLQEVAGVAANPMPQASASRIGLFTVAEYLWNDRAYDPEAAWRAALRERAGEDPAVREALRVFADASFFSRMTGRQAPGLAARIAAFRAGPDDAAARARLRADLAALRDAPRLLRAHLPDRRFVRETGPWLEAAEAWGTAAVTAADLAAAARDGDRDTARALAQRLPGEVERAQSFRYTHLYGLEIPVLVGDGVVDDFVLDAVAAYDVAEGRVPRPKGLTNLEPDQEHLVPRLTDGTESTYFRGLWDPRPGAYVGLDLRAAREIGTVRLAMGAPDRPEGYPRQGVVEVSADGRTWQPLGRLTGTPEVEITAPPGTTARYVRLRLTHAQSGLEHWLTVREFQVGAGSGAGAGAGAGGGLKR
ncbi:beta-N-acetylglucosaminidase domain-containing protein [Streptomyces sp. NPDC003077]|uniref:beta-N-acetylglucosaminidase domain-containing protein n=1 Tax=Streptomyces sp. NPDC003077 TaxID=3154443 RepID=UPI0033A56E13